MATSLETIRRLTIIGQSQGVDALVTEMRALDAAQRAAAASAAPLARTTDESAKRALSAAGAFDRLRRGIDEDYRSSVAAEKGLRTIQAALDQGAISAAEAARAVDLLAVKYQSVGAASAAGAGEVAAETERMAAAAAKLKATLDPLTAAQTRLNAEIAEYTALQSAGLITADELARAQTAAVARFEATAKSVDGVGKTTALAQHEVTNLGAQLTDIGISLAGGQSPFLVMAQQGTTVASILGSRGLGASVAAVGSGLLAIINPTTLFLAGITAVGYAGYYAFSRIGDAAEPIEKTLETHERLTRQISEAYDLAGGAAERFAAQSKAVTLNEAVRNAAALRAELDKIVAAGLQTDRGLFSQFAGRMSSSSFLTSTASGGFSGEAVLGVASAFEAYREPIEAFIASVRSGQPDVKKLRDEVAAFANASDDPAIKTLGDQILDTTNAAAQFASKVDFANAQLRLINGTATESDRILLGVSTAAERATKAFEALQSLSQIAVPELSIPQQIDAKRLEALRNASGTEDRISANAAADAALQRYRDSLVPTPPRNPARDLTSDYGVEAADAAQGAADATRDRLAALRETLAAEQLNLALVGKGVEETERLRFARENLADAEAEAAQNGTAVSKAYREEVERTAAAYGALRIAIEAAGLANDLAFERAQIGRSDTEQRVASELRALYGEDYGAQMDGPIAAQIRYNEALQQTHDLMQGFASDLRQGLANGEDFWTAFGDAASNTLDTLLDKLTTLATNYAFNALLNPSGGGTSGTSGLFGSLLSLFGVGGGSAAPGYTFGAAVPSGLYASGGFTGAGGRNEPAGIVHRGEYVFDAASVGRIGVGPLEALRSGSMPGYAEGGYVSPTALLDDAARRGMDRAAQAAAPVVRSHAAAGAAAPNINVVVNAPPGTEVASTEQRRNGNGGSDLIVNLVNKQTNKLIATGGADAAMRGRFGQRPTKIKSA